MTDPIPVNLSAITTKQAQIEAQKIIAAQVSSNDRFTEDVEEGFNPAAAERMQSRLNRFRGLEDRKKAELKGEVRIQEVDRRAEEDLAQDFHKRNPELPVGRLRALRQAITDNSTEEEILDSVSSAFKDPTLADEALDYLSRTTTGALREKVRRARNTLNSEKGREILAGRNVDRAAKSFHGKGLGESATELRELYREVTGTLKDHNTLFTELSEKYPFDDLKLVIAFLLQGLGYDLKSKGPSIQEAELIFLMTELRNLQSILWVYFFFKARMKLIRALYAKYGLILSKALTFELLAKEFIKLVEERYPTVLKLLKQMEKLGLVDIAKIIVLSQFRDAIRGLSPRVYKSVRHQQDLLVVILETLDELEEKEEALLEEEEEQEKKKKK